LTYLDDGLRSEEDIREKLGLTTLAVVPRYRRTRKGGVREGRDSAAAAEAYRRLRTNLLFSSVDRPLTSVVVTSVSPGEGKTRTAANLAAITAAVDQRVLLVDADMRRPRQHTIFGQAPQEGMSELLLMSGRAGATSEVNGRHRTQHANLSLLSAGTIPPNPAELLASKHLGGVVHSLERQFDLVVFDTPPASLVTDALTLASKTSGVIVVIESGRTGARQVRATIDSLRSVGATVIGVVLNKMDNKRAPGAYGYGYGYTAQGEGSDPGAGGWVPIDDGAPLSEGGEPSRKSGARALPAK
jgi:capsular exopolysaccharide synthesis family protein